MASNRHAPAVEPGELIGSTPPPTIPVPAPQPVPPSIPLSGPILRHLQPPQHRPPFLWGREEKVLGQGAFGTVTLVCQMMGHQLWRARTVGIIPAPPHGIIPPHKDPKSLYMTLPIWREYELLKRVRDEGQVHVVAAIEQHKIYVPRESLLTEIDDYPVVDERARTISITMEYASLGDLRHYME